MKQDKRSWKLTPRETKEGKKQKIKTQQDQKFLEADPQRNKKSAKKYQKSAQFVKKSHQKNSGTTSTRTGYILLFVKFQ